MFTLQTFTSILAFLSFSVQAFPLSQRDVAAPPILQPNASSIWPIGTIQLVIWDTSGLPAQITNPTAQIILGYNESDSLNLDFDNPLAQNFLISAGSVQITVPNVPPRDDYLIVLYGDSGDTSPAFAITRISTGDSAASLSSAPSDSISGATPPVTSLSISSSVITPTSTDTDSSTVDPPTVLPTTGTTTTSSTSSSSISDSDSVSSSASALAASSTSAGRSLHRGGSSLWNSAAPFLMSVAPFVFMI